MSIGIAPRAPLPLPRRAIGLSTINGLPAHVLLVHVVVVFVPLAAIALFASLWPTVARRLGLLLPAVAVIAFLSVLLAMNAGGWLQNHVANTALVRRHTQLAGLLWPFSAAVLLLSVVVWRRTPRAHASRPPSRGRRRLDLRAVVALLSVVMAVASVVQVVRIGDSGSRAAWHDRFSTTAVNHRG